MKLNGKKRTSQNQDAFDERLKIVGAMFSQGYSRAEVAEEFGVSRQTTSRWYANWVATDSMGPFSKGPSGRKSKLDETQLYVLAGALRKLPKDYGLTTKRWTQRQVATLIKSRFGIDYHVNHVWRLLKTLPWKRFKQVRHLRKYYQN